MFAAPFCIPVPRTLPFGAIIMEVLPELYGEHPEFEDIDWKSVQWFNSSKRFIPDVGKSLEHHGLGHKSLIRFRTPALEGIRVTAAQGGTGF
ncbi:MAG: hypothetical protein RI904_2946 [Pseudomonadota bacterium]